MKIAEGLVKKGGGLLTIEVEVGPSAAAFVARNYDWAVKGTANAPGSASTVALDSYAVFGETQETVHGRLSIPDGGALLLGGQLAREKGAPVQTGGTFLDDVQADFLARATQDGWQSRPGLPPSLTTYNGLRAFVSPQVSTSGTVLDVEETMAVDRRQVVLHKLRSNLGQKVAVNSINLNNDAASAAGLGVQWNKGNNDVNYAVVDEAVLRSLLELDARQRQRGAVVAENGRLQETIVGTDALLANGMIGNMAFAGERSNTLDLNDNTIALPHEKVLLVDNGGYLTAVKAGAMQHWTERLSFETVQFAEVPQAIEPPHEGRLVRLEKRLLEPSDRMVIGIEYTTEGESK